jgi:hypothetical protein
MIPISELPIYGLADVNRSDASDIGERNIELTFRIKIAVRYYQVPTSEEIPGLQLGTVVCVGVPFLVGQTRSAEMANNALSSISVTAVKVLHGS